MKSMFRSEKVIPAITWAVRHRIRLRPFRGAQAQQTGGILEQLMWDVGAKYGKRSAH